MKNGIDTFCLYLADNALILAQRNSEWCGHGPVLEQDIAITNISLDLIGQARNFYQHVAALRSDGSTEDSLAYLRTEREFLNCLLVEQPKGDWAQTILRQFFFSAYQFFLYTQLEKEPPGGDEQIAAIAAKSLKEVAYHLRWSSEWVIRLGDGTDESHKRMINAIDHLWPYTGELFIPAAFEEKEIIGFDLTSIRKTWMEKVNTIFTEAGLTLPESKWMHTGGKQGVHTEEMGFLLAELQYMQRAFPDSIW